MRLDWRPLVGLTSRDQGTLVERVIARVVLDEVIDLHNAEVRNAQLGT
jgi:hypothetical protein